MNSSLTPSPLSENYRNRQDDQREACKIVPPQRLLQIQDRESREDGQSNHFLNRLQLRGGKLVGTDAVRWNLEAVLKKSDQPAYDNDLVERHLAIFQMSIPREGHEDIRDGQQHDRPHGAIQSFQR